MILGKGDLHDPLFSYLSFMKLNFLTDQQLLKDTLSLVERERQTLQEILHHLVEIQKRKLYSDLKCKSLFEYCVKILKFSEGEASRRISACRMLIEMPDISNEIKTGELNLTKLNLAKSFFQDNNIKTISEKKQILAQLKGKTTRQSEQILWEIKNGDAPKRVTISLLEETIKELDQVKALKAHSCKNYDMLLQKMSKEMREKWSPKESKRPTISQNKQSRYIPRAIKFQLWKRYQGKCSICHSNHALQVDHIKPIAVGGETVLENLRLLCRNCNQRQSITFFQKPSEFFSSSTS